MLNSIFNRLFLVAILIVSFIVTCLFNLKAFGKRISLAIFALLVTGFAMAGMYNTTFPIIGGSSYCGSTVNATCVTTIVAGPTAVTGSELVLADTGLASGQNPQTALLSMRALQAAPITYYLCTAAACGSNTIGNNSGGILLDYTTTITSATVVTPASPMDGQRFKIASPYTITSLTVTANTGQTLSVTTPTVLTASTTTPQGYEFTYVSSTAKWYRVQ